MNRFLILAYILSVFNAKMPAVSIDYEDIYDTAEQVALEQTIEDEDLAVRIVEDAEEDDDVVVHILKTEDPIVVTPASYGETGEHVYALQEKLRIYGFTLEDPDGYYGLHTKAFVGALQKYLYGKVDEKASKLTGNVSQALCDVMNSPSFPKYQTTLERGTEGFQTMRVQRRLFTLGYLARDEVDCIYGAVTEDAVMRFQRAMGISDTGIADEETQNLLFDENAIACGIQHTKYIITVSIPKKTVTVYAWSNIDQNYSTVQQEMPCEFGIEGFETPTGTFKITRKVGDWQYFRMHNSYARYVTSINGAALYIQSHMYARLGDTEPIETNSSHGSIRLELEDAEWIYENCGIGTPVTIVGDPAENTEKTE